MNKLAFILAILLLFYRCTVNQESKVSNSIEVDTVYGGNPSDHSNYQKLICRYIKTPDFKIGKEDTFEIEFPRFEKYPIHIGEPINVLINHEDTVNGIFVLTPLDTVFSFKIGVDFGFGNVVFKAPKDTGFAISPFNGLRYFEEAKFKAEL